MRFVLGDNQRRLPQLTVHTTLVVDSRPLVITFG
jgi:hypothetical protein